MTQTQCEIGEVTRNPAAMEQCSVDSACRTDSYTVCPLLVVGGSIRTGAIVGIVVGSLVGGCMAFAIIGTENAEALTLPLFAITVCVSGLIGVVSGLVRGMRQLNSMRRVKS